MTSGSLATMTASAARKSNTETTFGSITVVIPSLNRRRCLRRVLASYAQQPCVQEIVVVDDHGEEALDAEELATWAGAPVRLLRLPRRTGSPGARNAGLELVTTDWLLCSDDDVFLSDSYVEELIRTQQATNADAVGGRRLYLLNGEAVDDALVRYASLPAEPFDPRLVMAQFGAPIAADRDVLHLQTTAIVRTELARAVGWDELLRPPSYREETDFFLRASAAGFRLVMSREAVCFNLPPGLAFGGGQWTMPRWRYELGAIKCNHRFLARNYAFLKSRGAIRGPRIVAELAFAAYRLGHNTDRLVDLAAYKAYRRSRLLQRLRRAYVRRQGR